MKVGLLNELWNVIDPSNIDTWPGDEQEVYYIFTPLGQVPVFEGKFYHDETHDGKPHGVFVADCGGFCDGYDAPFWRLRGEEE